MSGTKLHSEGVRITNSCASSQANVAMPWDRGHQREPSEKEVLAFNNHHRWKTGRRTYCVSAPSSYYLKHPRYLVPSPKPASHQVLEQVMICPESPALCNMPSYPIQCQEFPSSCSFAIPHFVHHNRKIIHARTAEILHHYNHISPPSPATHLRHASEYADSKSRTQRRVSKSGLVRRLS